ncbi:MAG: hypothetical protein ACM3VW_10210 [Bacteroidota bacterium]
MSEGMDKSISIHRTTNQVVGLLIMLVGIALLVFVFLAAYHMYQSISAGTFGLEPAVQAPRVPGTPPHSLPSGGVSAGPAAVTPAVAALVVFARLFALLVMGWLAGLLASKGVALATGTPLRH